MNPLSKELKINFLHTNSNGIRISSKDPNNAWPAGLSFSHVENDRWEFSKTLHGWTRVQRQDVYYPEFLELNKGLQQARCVDMTIPFLSMGYELTYSMAVTLVDSFVVPINNGYVFVRSLPHVVAFIFISDSDRRLGEIQTMRNKINEISMNDRNIKSSGDVVENYGFSIVSSEEIIGKVESFSRITAYGKPDHDMRQTTS